MCAFPVHGAGAVSNVWTHGSQVRPYLRVVQGSYGVRVCYQQNMFTVLLCTLPPRHRILLVTASAAADRRRGELMATSKGEWGGLGSSSSPSAKRLPHLCDRDSVSVAAGALYSVSSAGDVLHNECDQHATRNEQTCNAVLFYARRLRGLQLSRPRSRANLQ